MESLEKLDSVQYLNIGIYLFYLKFSQHLS